MREWEEIMDEKEGEIHKERKSRRGTGKDSPEVSRGLPNASLQNSTERLCLSPAG